MADEEEVDIKGTGVSDEEVRVFLSYSSHTPIS